MHNCKSTRSSFIDLALAEMPPARSSELLAELNACATCQESYAALRSTLHVSGQALRSTTPGEGFWLGYHDRLRQSLLSGVAGEKAGVDVGSMRLRPARVSTGQRLWLVLRMALTTSVRVPVPAALALMFLFVISVVALRWQVSVNAPAVTSLSAPEIRTVTVPVVQEKVVTRVVYVERKSGRGAVGHRALSNTANNLASAAPSGSSKAGLNLVGFEPTDQLKLTIIKGSYRDEK